MSYTPTNWIDGETPVNAENMNKLEQAVQANATAIEEINTARENDEFKGAPGKTAYEYALDGGYVGTEEEFAKKLAVDYIDWFGRGIELSSGTNVDTLKTNGKYFARNKTTVNSLAGTLPDGLGGANFTMYVFERTTVKSQLIIDLNGKMFIRSTSESAWYPWVAYTTSEEIEELVASVKEKLVGSIEQELEKHSGVYTLAEGETIADAPEWAQVVVDPYAEPAELEMVATFEDGTTATYTIYGEVVVG